MRAGSKRINVPKVLIADDDRVTRHLLRKVLQGAGFAVTLARDGADALARLRDTRVDVVLLDIWMPRMSGLDVLARLRARKRRPKVIVMTSDDAPATLLEAVRQEAVEYVHKPVEPLELLRLVRSVLEEAEPPRIEVVSARPEWLELVAPCTREAAERVHTVVARLDTDLDPDVRDSVGFAFRELLINAVEWGGKLDPSRKVRISYLRGRRMVLYRIADPGPGFRIEELAHAAIAHPDSPTDHVLVREEKGLRPGGFGLLMVRESVDELIYNEKRNEVVFIRYLPQ
jgi:CheY-like chemotaxis protein/anti-sigma regulatory factor (Ser/Thr protein kinase)